jgi:hypothetical protein
VFLSLKSGVHTAHGRVRAAKTLKFLLESEDMKEL